MNVLKVFRKRSAWISATGSSAALADLDGDGLPNDLCRTEPRTDTSLNSDRRAIGAHAGISSHMIRALRAGNPAQFQDMCARYLSWIEFQGAR